METNNGSLTTLLRATPALLSAAAVSMTLCEDVFFRPFGKPQAALRPQANRLLRAHVAAFATRGMSMTATFYLGDIAVGTANLMRLRGSDGLFAPAPAFYLAGAVFSAMHFAFAPRDIALMNVITDESKVDEAKEKDNCTAMAGWIQMNVTRGLLADFPALICNLVGLTLAIA